MELVLPLPIRANYHDAVIIIIVYCITYSAPVLPSLAHISISQLSLYLLYLTLSTFFSRQRFLWFL